MKFEFGKNEFNIPSYGFFLSVMDFFLFVINRHLSGMR